jgi:hypothetical protein
MMVIFAKFWVLPWAVFALGMQGCATTTPSPLDPLAYQNRAKSSVNEGLAVTVAVPTVAEAQAIYGVELASKEIQAVWVKVKNESADTYWFLTSGLDPEYFSPPEVAFAFHSASDETNRRLDKNFQKLQFKNPVQPGSVVSGFVLVNLDEGIKAIDIDLISRSSVKNCTFILEEPDFKGDLKLIDFDTL